MSLSLSQIISIVAIFQLIVFVISLLSRKFNRLPNRILAAFLIFQAIICFNYLVKTNFAPINSNAYLFLLIGDPAFWVVSPLLYFYVRSLCFSNFKFNYKDLFHLSPAAIIMVMIALSFITTGERPLHEASYMKNINLHTPQGISYVVLMYSQFLIYNILSLQVIASYRRRLKMQVSSIYKIFLTWLKIVIVGFMVAWIVNFAVSLLVVFNLTLDFDVASISFFTFLVFFNVMFFKGWTQSDLFSGVEESRKYQSSGMSEDEAEKYMERLTDCMEQGKPYLDAEISLKKLSENASIPIRQLSQLINENMGSNFYDFINGYRIEMSKKLLIISDKTVSEILYESGFNSKSSFNTAFKKETGLTPTEFRAKNRV